ncbi:F-box/LRR-repeat protein At4g14103-like [Silene latifolia]|uniref:F-box/LRR-repeat protein At4g14103-like n=1 Tax=Silene latifolia TaxID=37657 RepID=UPI003D78AA91
MNYEKIGRLELLPKEILITILSFLPTKHAVATAILSRSWRYLWTQITALRFTITDFPEHKLNAIIFFIIKRVSWRYVNAIELIINNGYPNAPDPTSLENVVHDIIYDGTNVKELKVFSRNFLKSTISLPRSILEKPTLEVLEVYANLGFSIGKVEVNDTHPNLKKLVISIREYDLKSFENLIKSSPLLEILRVHVQVLEEFNDPIKLNAKNLKYSSMNFVYEKHTIEKNKITLNTPKLHQFEFHSSCMVELCFLKTPIGLSKAKLFMGDERPLFFLNHVFDVFNPIFRVKTLKLSGDLLLALTYPGFKVKVFDNLSHVEMGLSYTQSWYGVKFFLEQCPNVETLVLKRACNAKWDNFNWPEFKFLPRRLHKKIQRIELWNFGGIDVVLPILCYIFSVAKALKKLHISIQNNGESKKINVSSKLLALSKTLPSCEINVLFYKDKTVNEESK